MRCRLFKGLVPLWGRQVCLLTALLDAQPIPHHQTLAIYEAKNPNTSHLMHLSCVPLPFWMVANSHNH